jgi:type IV pilus assembly protein PilY1
MTHRPLVICSILISMLASAISIADDTEIYGTAGNTGNTLAKPNVMFIMDTSGSMKVEVINRPAFDGATNYNGNYPADHFFSGLGQGNDKGHKLTAITGTTNCDATVATMNNLGKVNGNYQQDRNGWRNSLENNNDNDIRCDNGGNNDWLYSADYMNWFNNYDQNGGTNTGKTRLQTVVDVVKGITNSIADVNMGLMRFDEGNGGGSDSDYGGGHVDVAIKDIATTKTDIQTKLDGYGANGGTPLTEVMYEAGRYYRGETPVFGNHSRPAHLAANATSMTGTSYKSPITAQCQKNHIILFTDGQASVDEEVNDEIQTLVAGIDFTSVPNLNKNCSGSGGCLDELTYWLNQTDHSTGTSGFTGIQPITTYTIGGFDLDDASVALNSAAVHGDGSFYQANNTVGLTEVLTEIFTEILATDSTFTAPAVSVNAFNASEHRNDLFYALFRPENKVKWGGNLKRYKIEDEEIVAYTVKQGDRTSTSATAPAIDEETGYFKDEVFDYWNTLPYPDGKNVTKGGMAHKVDYVDRVIFSNNISDNMASFDDVASFTSFNMLASDFTATSITDWVKGRDTLNADGDTDGDTTDNRFSIGDPLHSEPVVVSYGGTEATPDATIFFGTNEGFIHGVSTETGEEQFAFLPYELHDIQNTYYTNTASVGDKPYGMDGLLTAWFKDVNKNGVLNSSGTTNDAGEHVYLYGGMRRGGRSYYGLDISNRDIPSMLFKITGDETSGFDNLGQTWSKMTIAKVKWNDEDKFVLFFTGGYDIKQDANNTRENDDVGNSIYMIDAEDGTLLWSASDADANLILGDMTNSMPATLSAIDITGNGFVNTLFAVDMGGRVFRVDINQTNTSAANFATGGLVAQVGDSTAAGNRRFYNKPNVALVKDKQYGDYYSIAIGSGYRAHPLNTTIEDRFYVIKDKTPYNIREDFDEITYKHITEAGSTVTSGPVDPTKLYNATKSMNGTLSNELKALLTGGAGWYVELSSSEKVLSESLTYTGTVIFSTFSPTVINGAACGADTGTARAYALDQKWAGPVLDLDGDGDVDANLVLKHSGIPPRPFIHVTPDEDGTLVPGLSIGLEVIKKNKDPDPKEPDCDSNNCFVTPVYWRQNDNNPEAEEGI